MKNDGEHCTRVIQICQYCGEHFYSHYNCEHIKLSSEQVADVLKNVWYYHVTRTHKKDATYPIENGEQS